MKIGLGCLASLILLGGVIIVVGYIASSVDPGTPPAPPVAQQSTPAAAPSDQPPRDPVTSTDDPAPESPTTPSTTPSASEVDPAFSYETPDLSSAPESPVIAAVAFCREKRVTPEQAFPTVAARIRVDSVAYLGEAADIIGVVGPSVHLMLADGTTAFLSGVNTRGLVSGRSILPGLVYVHDTVSYETLLGGTNTGWALRAIGNSEWAKAESALDRIEQVAQRNKMRDELQKLRQQLDAPRFDTYVSADGKHTTEATVLAYADGVFSMRRTDGRTVDVPLERLDAKSKDLARQRIGTLSRAKARAATITKVLKND